MAEAAKGGQRVVITYGTYDLFHYGHQALLEHAKALGDYLIVGVTSDAFDKSRGKLNVRQPLIERVHAVEATGLADKIIVEEFKGQKIDDIRKYHVDVFTVGSDWVGKFDYLKEYCDVVYLPRTEGVSSTELRKNKFATLGLGIVGLDAYSNRIIREASYVSGVEVLAAMDVHDGLTRIPSEASGIKAVGCFQDMAEIVDAVYIHVSSEHRFKLIEQALSHGLHVLCEGPIAYRGNDAARLLRLAEERSLVLMEAHTALYEPGFQRLKLLLESGVIGEIKDIDASYSIIADDIDFDDPFDSSFYSMSSRSLLPAMVFLGPEFRDANIVCGYEGGFCTWTKFDLLFPTAAATLKTGRGIKTEGDMTITGTDGYVYIPAPWWKLEYFEIRGEDLRNTKKHFYECAGEGQRYLIKKFSEFCSDFDFYFSERKSLESIEVATVGLIERVDTGGCFRLENHSGRFGGGEAVVENT